MLSLAGDGTSAVLSGWAERGGESHEVLSVDVQDDCSYRVVVEPRNVPSTTADFLEFLRRYVSGLDLTLALKSLPSSAVVRVAQEGSLLTLCTTHRA